MMSRAFLQRLLAYPPGCRREERDPPQQSGLAWEVAEEALCPRWNLGASEASSYPPRDWARLRESPCLCRPLM